jgi:hypothetical protein
MSDLDDLFERAKSRPDVYLPALRAEIERLNWLAKAD